MAVKSGCISFWKVGNPLADNSPNSVQRPPWPNIVVQLNRRVEQHVCTLAVAGGTPSITQALSSSGMAVSDGGAGIYDITFPAGGTGAVGWIEVCAPNQSTPAAIIFVTDSDTTNFATGVLSLRAFDAATPSAVDLVGSVTILINVIKAAA